MNHLDELYKLKRMTEHAIKKTSDSKRQQNHQRSYDAICWAINRLDPRLNNYTRIPANQKHYRNTKTYSITMSPEDHDRLVQLGKELHIGGGFSGVLTYIAQNCVLTHKKSGENG